MEASFIILASLFKVLILHCWPLINTIKSRNIENNNKSKLTYAQNNNNKTLNVHSSKKIFLVRCFFFFLIILDMFFQSWWCWWCVRKTLEYAMMWIIQSDLFNNKLDESEDDAAEIKHEIGSATMTERGDCGAERSKRRRLSSSCKSATSKNLLDFGYSFSPGFKQ